MISQTVIGGVAILSKVVLGKLTHGYLGVITLVLFQCTFTNTHFLKGIYRVAAWIAYNRLLPDIIGYFRIVLKFMNFRVAKMYENNGMFYGSTKI